MKDCFEFVHYTLQRYNDIQNKIKTSPDETTDDEDLFLDHFQVNMAKALYRDYSGAGKMS